MTTGFLTVSCNTTLYKARSRKAFGRGQPKSWISRFPNFLSRKQSSDTSVFIRAVAMKYLPLVLFVLGIALPATSQSTIGLINQGCQKLASQSPDQLYWPGSSSYLNETASEDHTAKATSSEGNTDASLFSRLLVTICVP